MAYLIVEFPNTKECEAVPSDWMSTDKTACWWPPYRRFSHLKKAIVNRELPDYSLWTRTDARVLGTAESYDDAEERANRATFRSDIGTEASDEEETIQSRKRRPVVRYGDSSDEERDIVQSTHKSKYTKKMNQQPDLPLPPPLPSLPSSSIATPPNLSLPSPLPSLPSLSVATATPPPQASAEYVILTASQTIQTPTLTLASFTANTDPLQSSSVAATSPSQASQIPAATPVSTTPRTVTAMERHIVRVLEELREQNRTIITLLQRQLAQSLSQEVDDNLPGGLKVPVQSIQELERLSTEADDSDVRGKLIRILALVGGGDVGQATRRMMKKLMCDSVAREYNFRGKGTKRSFAALRLKTIVCDAVRRNPETARATDNEVENEMKNWLKFAKDRDGGRRLRYIRAQNTAL